MATSRRTRSYRGGSKRTSGSGALLDTVRDTIGRFSGNRGGSSRGGGGLATQASGNGQVRALANWMTNELAARIGDSDPAGTALKPAAFAHLVAMVDSKQVSASAAKDVLDVLIQEGGDPAAIVERQGLGRADSSELEAIVERAIADNPDAVEKIRAGKAQAIGAIVGAVMRETKGRADGGEVQRMISERLNG